MEMYFLGVAISGFLCCFTVLTLQWWKGLDVFAKDLILTIILALLSWAGVLLIVLCWIIQVCSWVLEYLKRLCSKPPVVIVKGRKKG